MGRYRSKSESYRSKTPPNRSKTYNNRSTLHFLPIPTPLSTLSTKKRTQKTPDQAALNFLPPSAPAWAKSPSPSRSPRSALTQIQRKKPVVPLRRIGCAISKDLGPYPCINSLVLWLIVHPNRPPNCRTRRRRAAARAAWSSLDRSAGREIRKHPFRRQPQGLWGRTDIRPSKREET